MINFQQIVFTIVMESFITLGQLVLGIIMQQSGITLIQKTGTFIAVNFDF